MTPITARDSKKKCNGFRGCGGVIFTGNQYYKLRRKKVLCKKCVDGSYIKQDDNEALTKLTNDWINN